MTEKSWQKLDDLDPSESDFPARATVDGEGIIIFKAMGGFRGVERRCPHLQSSLADGILMGNGTMLRCSRHNYTFKLIDGKGVNCPGYRLRIFEVKQEGNNLFARPLDVADATNSEGAISSKP